MGGVGWVVLWMLLGEYYTIFPSPSRIYSRCQSFEDSAVAFQNVIPQGAIPMIKLPIVRMINYLLVEVYHFGLLSISKPYFALLKQISLCGNYTPLVTLTTVLVTRTHHHHLPI